MSVQQQVPLKISIAPFPEGFEGDADEYGQQLVQLMEAYIEGNFLTGLILPAGSTLPTTDQGPIAMGGSWYFFDPVSGTYQPQSISAKVARNYAKNATYQIAQLPAMASSFTVPLGDTNTYDMVVTRATIASVLAIAADTGPPASGDTDNCLSAIKYTVGPTLVPTLAATDRFIHEHLIEGSDIVMLQGETLTLAFSVFTNVPGTYSVYLTTGARDASYVANFTVQAANVWQRVRITGIPALPVSTLGTWSFGEGTTGLRIGVVFAIGSNSQTATTNLNKWISGGFCGTANNSNLCTVINNQFKISAIKLEASPTATYCTVNSFEQDLHDAIRYYWTNFTYQLVNAGTATQAVANVANNVLFTQLFPRRMCKVPTVVPYGFTSYAAGKVTNFSTATDYTVATIGATQKGVTGQPTGLTAAKGDVFAAYLKADATLT